MISDFWFWIEHVEKYRELELLVIDQANINKYDHFSCLITEFFGKIYSKPAYTIFITANFFVIRAKTINAILNLGKRHEVQKYKLEKCQPVFVILAASSEEDRDFMKILDFFYHKNP